MAELQPNAHDKAPEMPWGLHLIGDATSEARQGEVAVDIIAVHGLGSNPDHAWVRHKNITAGPGKDVRWLTDLLPRTFCDFQPSIGARIFCFNYQSAWLGPQLSRNRLEGLARRLLDDIHNARDKNGAVSNRPIIFIGHSFGGLVIEQAVVQAQSAGSRYEYIVKLIGGVVFLGTPHQGSKTQSWGSIVANLANLIDYGETGLMKEVDEKSMKIFDLISEFKRIMISMDLAKTAVICFYENLPTSYLSRVIKTGSWFQRQISSMVVEETSAVLSGFYSVVLDSDHLKLNKFASAQDGNYVSVSSNLCRIAAEAPELIRKRRNGTASSQESYFLVSRERVKDFIGRGSLLDTIRSHFSGNQTGPPPCLILHALGGQGKSQIALEYCRKWRETYRGIFWINANSETTITQSYAMIAAELTGNSRIETSDSAAQIKLVKERLEQWCEAWLLVFDNYDEPERFPDIRKFIPTKGYGHVLFTSRNRNLSRLGTLLDIPPMATEEGVRLLLRAYNDNEIQQRHKDTASSIVERLGNLALAIDQAEAYIRYKRILLDRLGDFLATYEAERKRILSYTPKNFWDYEHINAFTTWELSFQQLGSGNEQWKKDAAHLLTLSAFLAPSTIAESMLRTYQEAHGSEVRWIQMFNASNMVEDDRDEDKEKEDDNASKQSFGSGFRGTWDADRFWDVIANMDELSLLQSISPAGHHEGANFSLHPLIRDWLQLRLMAKERQEYTHEAIKVLVSCVRAYQAGSMTVEQMTALTTHVDVSVSNDEEFLEPQDRLGNNIANCSTANWFAFFYNYGGRYHASERISRRMVETRKNLLSEKHPLTLESMNYLAMLLSKQCKYEEAESIQRRTLALRETILGKNHADTLSSVSNLASLLFHQGKLEESEKMFRKTTLLKEMIQGKEHPSTLLTMSNLAEVLMNQNKYEEAERILRQTIRLQDTILGKTHPSTLTSMNNLAGILGEQNKYEEAEWICRDTLMSSEKVLGREHPDTLMCMNNLAAVLKYQRKFEEAERLFQQTLKLREKVLGKEHHDTLTTMSHIAEILYQCNKDEEAEQLYRQAWMLREKVLGTEHSSTLTTLGNLKVVLRRRGKNEEAERLSPGMASWSVE